jgi:hypothetical protein
MASRETFPSATVATSISNTSHLRIDWKYRIQRYEELRISPKTPDLTVLTRNNGGLFPVNRVIEIIDGRTQVKGHGTREMPIWGDVYNAQAVPQFDEYPHNAALFVWARTLALVDYLNRLQVK